MIGESFLDYFHFDSKFFRTLVPLLFKPGQLTLEYMKGKRKSYVEPFRLFLVVSVIYFLLLPLSGGSTHDQPKPAATGSAKTLKKSPDFDPNNSSLNGKSLTGRGQDSIRKEIDSVGLQRFVDKNFAKDGWAVKLLMRQAYKIVMYSGQSFYTVLEHTASKMIFLLIPVFALLLKLVYRKSRRLYYEHLIFSLHIHAFVFLLLIAGLLIGFLIPVDLWILITISLIYLFFALKRNYGKRSGRSFGKLSILILLYFIIALPVFFMILVVVSFFLV